MRQVLSVLFVLCVAACGPPLRWEKPGVDALATATDLAGCRRAAQDEAMRSFPLYSTWYTPYGRSLSWLHADADRANAEDRLTAFCMRTKGYALVEVKPQTTAPAPPAQPTPEEK
jgi:hypothetical protein